MKRSLGKMRHQLLIKALVRVPDGAGGFARADTTHDPNATVWARVSTASPFETTAYGQLQQRATHRAIVRRNAKIVEGVTLIWQRPASHGGSLSLYVLSVGDADPDGRPGEFMALALREGGNL